MTKIKNYEKEFNELKISGFNSYTSAVIIIATSMRIISKDELNYFIYEFAKNNNIHNVKPNSRLEKIIKKISSAFQFDTIKFN